VTAVAIALAGALGAVVRWLLDLAAAARLGRALPWGTMAANVAGSLLAGALAGATVATHLGPTTTQVLAVGFCGGLTTFSAAVFDVARELERRRAGLGALVLFAPMLAALGAGLAGFYVAGG